MDAQCSSRTKKRITVSLLPILILGVLCDSLAGTPRASVNVPAFEIEVHQAGGEVEFSFYLQQMTPMVLRIPVQVSSLSVMTSLPVGVAVPPFATRGREVWAIYQPQGGSEAQTVKYGVVPKAFIQDVPASGAPAPLVRNTEYVVSAGGYAGVGSARFVYKNP